MSLGRVEVSSAGPERALGRRRLQLDSELAQSFLRRRRRRARQRIGSTRRLRERDDLAESRLAGEERDEALDAEREPAVRRRAHLQRLEEPAELGLRVLVGHAHRAKDALLNLLPMDPDRAGAELLADEDEVVMQAERRARVTFDEVVVSVDRAGERVVDERRVPRVVAAQEEREV